MSMGTSPVDVSQALELDMRTDATINILTLTSSRCREDQPTLFVDSRNNLLAEMSRSSGTDPFSTSNNSRNLLFDQQS